MKILSALVVVVFVAAASSALAQGSPSEKGDDAEMMDGGAHPKSHKGKKHEKSKKMDGGMMDHHGGMMDGGSMDHGGMMEGHPGTDGGM